MVARLQKSLKEKDQGFTLIELLVVIVIIGILAAIAIPLFLSQREKGVQAGMKADLKALATQQETYFIDNATYAATVDVLRATPYGFRNTDGNTFNLTVTGNVWCADVANTAGTTATYKYTNATSAITDGTCP